MEFLWYPKLKRNIAAVINLAIGNIVLCANHLLLRVCNRM